MTTNFTWKLVNQTRFIDKSSFDDRIKNELSELEYQKKFPSSKCGFIHEFFLNLTGVVFRIYVLNYK